MILVLLPLLRMSILVNILQEQSSFHQFFNILKRFFSPKANFTKLFMKKKKRDKREEKS